MLIDRNEVVIELGVSKQTLKKICKGVDIEYRAFYEPFEIDILKQNCYVWQRNHTDHTVLSLAEKLGVTKQSVHAMAVKHKILDKHHKKSLILTDAEVKKIRGLYELN